MFDGQKVPNLANNTIIFATLIAAAGSLFFRHEAPLDGLRPAATEKQFHQAASVQDVEARLWQDPFAAVATALDEAANKRVGQQPEKPDNHSKSPLVNEDMKTTVLVVTMSGAPYFDDAEFRRRTRYAVLAGLYRRGLTPVDAQHISYFKPQKSEDAQCSDKNLRLPEAIPFEWFNDPSGLRRTLVLWLDEDILSKEPLTKFSRFVQVLWPKSVDPRISEDNGRIKVIGPQLSSTLREMVKEVSNGEKPASCDLEEKPPTANFNLPEPNNQEKKSDAWPLLRKVDFYSYGATVEDKMVLGASQEYFSCKTDPGKPLIHKYFEEQCLHVYRTVVTDDVIARGIVKELKQRGVEPGKPKSWWPMSWLIPGKHHLALISEQDTFYGQTFPGTMERNFADADLDKREHDWIHKQTYLRGLDGALPQVEAKEERNASNGPSQSNGQAGGKELTKSQTDVRAFDRPHGQSQQDYLRRLADKLRTIDHKLSVGGAGSITAIGILGNDVFDKLQVLRALRPNFPDALFFTADYDAALTMQSELSWSRNLIISSSFGPELREEIQGDIPPFRSTYQTSAFLATLMATSYHHYPSAPTLNKWLSVARLFEIERTGRVLPFPRLWEPNEYKEKEGPFSKPTEVAQEKENCKRNIARNCIYVQPSDEELRFVPMWSKLSHIFVGMALIVAGLLVLRITWNGESTQVREVLICDRSVGFVWRAFPIVLAVGALFVALMCFLWPAGFGDWLSENGRGEPIALIQGVSLWPTVLIRMLGIVVCVYLITRASISIDENRDYVKRKLDLNESNGLGNTSLFSYRLYKGDSHKKYNYKVEDAWHSYYFKGSCKSRVIRVATFMGGMLILFLILCSIFGFPVVPARGSLTRFVFWTATILDIALVLFLVFFVLDATLLCWSFVNDLSLGQTHWPTTTKNKYMNMIGLNQEKKKEDGAEKEKQRACDQNSESVNAGSVKKLTPEQKFDQMVRDDLLDYWIDLVFIEKRTKCLSSLVYYPFIVIALMIFSRSALFANFSWSAPILICEALSLFIVLGCAVALNLSAERARRLARRKFTDAIVTAKGLDDRGSRAGILECMRGRIEELNEGAFTPFLHQPFVGAALLPLGTFGWAVLFDRGIPSF